MSLFTLLQSHLVKLTPALLFTILAASASAQPLKVCVIQDKSTSGIEYGTPNMTYPQIVPLLDSVDERAGEVAYGLIQSKSNKPLHRYYAPKLPPKPVLDTEGLSPKEKRVAFQHHKIKLASWFKKRKKRSEDLEQKRHTFRLGTKDDISLDYFATSSDIFGALHRCLVYLDEITPELSISPKKYVVLISDSEHTNGIEPPVRSLPGDVTLIIVNGKRWAGSLKDFEHTSFEGIDAAFRFVLSNSKTEEV